MSVHFSRIMSDLPAERNRRLHKAPHRSCSEHLSTGNEEIGKRQDMGIQFAMYIRLSSEHSGFGLIRATTRPYCLFALNKIIIFLFSFFMPDLACY